MKTTPLQFLAFTAFACGTVPAQAAPSLPAGTYVGSYRCLQGSTPLTLEVRPDGTGRYRFGEGTANAGAYSVRFVSGEGRTTEVVPVRWERQPRGFVMVGARLTPQKDGRFAGQITHSSCGAISVTRLNVVSAPQVNQANVLPRSSQLGSWEIISEQQGRSAQVVAPLRHGESVTLIMSCYENRPSVQVGYSDNHTHLPEPRRKMVYDYMRGIYVDEPVLIFMKGSKALGRLAWSSYDGGYGKVGRSQLGWFYSADRIILSGGKQRIDFGVQNIKAAVAGIRPRCNL